MIMKLNNQVAKLIFAFALFCSFGTMDCFGAAVAAPANTSMPHKPVKPHRPVRYCDMVVDGEICRKTATSWADLAKHQHTHTRQRPYRCHDCPMAFTDPSNWRRHEKNKHPEAYNVRNAHKVNKAQLEVAKIRLQQVIETAAPAAVLSGAVEIAPTHSGVSAAAENIAPGRATKRKAFAPTTPLPTKYARDLSAAAAAVVALREAAHIPPNTPPRTNRVSAVSAGAKISPGTAVTVLLDASRGSTGIGALLDASTELSPPRVVRSLELLARADSANGHEAQ